MVGLNFYVAFDPVWNCSALVGVYVTLDPCWNRLALVCVYVKFDPYWNLSALVDADFYVTFEPRLHQSGLAGLDLYVVDTDFCLLKDPHWSHLGLDDIALSNVVAGLAQQVFPVASPTWGSCW